MGVDHNDAESEGGSCQYSKSLSHGRKSREGVVCYLNAVNLYLYKIWDIYLDNVVLHTL